MNEVGWPLDGFSTADEHRYTQIEDTGLIF